MKVLVTGAGGALGGLVAERLAAGRSVRAHDRTTINGPDGDVITGDLADLAHVRAVVAGVDAVVHCAAIPSPTDYPDDEIFRNNVQAAYNVLDTAGRAGVGRIVYISSASALGLAWSQLGVSPAEVPVTEDHPFVGDDVYGLSKQVGETIAAATSRRWRTTVVSLRFPFIGTGTRLADHLKRIHHDPGVDRGGLWAWLDIRDAVRAVEAALTVPLDGHHLLNVVAPDTTALVSTAELLGTYHPTAVITRPFGGFESVYSGRLCRTVLGFEPIYGWRDAG